MKFSFKIIAFYVLGVLGLIFFVFLGISPFIFKQPPVVTKPVPGDFKTNYSNFNQLTPGKNTKEDIVQLNGKPDSEKTTGTKTIFYYNTPSDYLKNVAVLENNILLYAMENVFAKYRGAPDEYQRLYGASDLTMYEYNAPGTEWRVYYSDGIAVDVGTFENVILKIAYFKPQSKDAFEKGLAKELGLFQTQIIPTETTNTILETTN